MSSIPIVQECNQTHTGENSCEIQYRIALKLIFKYHLWAKILLEKSQINATHVHKPYPRKTTRGR